MKTYCVLFFLSLDSLFILQMVQRTKKEYTVHSSDASLHRLGVYDCHTLETHSRQISEAEGESENIGGLEALALEMCVLNVSLVKHPRVIRFEQIKSKK